MTPRLIVLLPLLFAPHKQQPTHGTINVLLANRNGVVLITDSRASDQLGRKVHDQSQKLFAIDESTVCSIAGFGTDPGPGNTFMESAGGEILSIAKGLANAKEPLSFKDKIGVFTDTLKGKLASLETAYEYSQKVPNAPEHKQQDLIMLFAGFDKDGVSIARTVITVKSTKSIGALPIFEGTSETEVKPVVNDLVYFTAGVDDTVRYRLEEPAAFSAEPAINDYNRAVHEGRTAELNLNQLKELARYLEKDASGYNVVGGPVQIATIADRQTKVDLPGNLLPFPPRHGVAFVFYNETRDLPYTFIVTPNGNHSVFVNNTCINAAVILDDQALIGGEYDRCNFFYNGGDFYRDPGVKINGGQLILGPRVELDSFLAKRALTFLPELKPIPIGSIPNGQVIADHIWGYEK